MTLRCQETEARRGVEKSRSVGILNRGGQQGGQLPSVSAALILTDGLGQSLLGGGILDILFARNIVQRQEDPTSWLFCLKKQPRVWLILRKNVHWRPLLTCLTIDGSCAMRSTVIIPESMSLSVATFETKVVVSWVHSSNHCRSFFESSFNSCDSSSTWPRCLIPPQHSWHPQMWMNVSYQAGRCADCLISSSTIVHFR